MGLIDFVVNAGKKLFGVRRGAGGDEIPPSARARWRRRSGTSA